MSINIAWSYIRKDMSRINQIYYRRYWTQTLTTRKLKRAKAPVIPLKKSGHLSLPPSFSLFLSISLPLSLSFSLSPSHPLSLSFSLYLPPSFSLFIYLPPSLSLTGEEGVQTLFTSQRERERERKRGGDREREREREGERERERKGKGEREKEGGLERERAESAGEL
jgi:hypothetical protein